MISVREKILFFQPRPEEHRYLRFHCIQVPPIPLRLESSRVILFSYEQARRNDGRSKRSGQRLPKSSDKKPRLFVPDSLFLKAGTTQTERRLALFVRKFP